LKLLHLSLHEWRNIHAAEIDCDARFVVFEGENAQGKTNCLEAIYTLATLKSFRSRKNRELIRFGQERARVGAAVVDQGVRRVFKLDVSSAGRQAEVDGKRPEHLRDYFDGIRAVLFAPEDTGMIRGDPSGRRRFLDRAAFTARPAFLDIARDYKRVLDQRGALLRTPAPDTDQLQVFDEQLIRLGVQLSIRRAEVIDSLRPHFVELHAAIAPGGAAEIAYRSCLGEGDADDRRRIFEALLRRSRAEELRRGMNLAGPHRDDLTVHIDGRPAKSFGSQGQVRTLVLALKLAELLAARARGARLIFLLDDLSSELDARRTAQLLGLLNELSLQTFITTTDPGRAAGLPAGEVRAWRVEGGQVLAPT